MKKTRDQIFRHEFAAASRYLRATRVAAQRIFLRRKINADSASRLHHDAEAFPADAVKSGPLRHTAHWREWRAGVARLRDSRRYALDERGQIVGNVIDMRRVAAAFPLTTAYSLDARPEIDAPALAAAGAPA